MKPVFILAALVLLVAQLTGAESFPLGPEGAVAHWVTSGRRTLPIAPTEGRDPARLLAFAPPAGVIEAMSAPIIALPPTGDRPRIVLLDDATCASDYAFYRERLRIETILAVDLLVPQAGRREFTLWCDRGAAEVIIGGRTVLQITQRTTPVEGHPFAAEVAAGANRILIRRIRVGERDTPLQTGLRCRGSVEDLRVALPLPQDVVANVLARHAWLRAVQAGPDGSLTAAQAPDFPVTITSAPAIFPWRPTQERRTFAWPPGVVTLARQDLGPGTLALRLVAGDPQDGLVRQLDWPYLAPLPFTAGGSLEERRHQLVASLDEADFALFAGLDALRHLDAGRAATDPVVGALVDRMVTTIAQRDGTSDFQMMAVIRLLFAARDRLTVDQRDRLQQVLTEVPYGSDEKNLGTMTFSSENHQVMFLAAARLAAVLMPQAVFRASGRTADEQRRVTAERLAAWFSVREGSGFSEFLAPAYTNETFLALLNLHDYDPDPALRQRARVLLDSIVSLAALHGFQGLPLGPNGRCYRHELLASYREGRSAILSWFAPEAIFAPHSITVALAHSTYGGPATPLDLRGSWERRDAMGGTVVVGRRTADYLLGTCTIPSPVAQEASNPFPFRAPGTSLYQHHVWEVSLGGHARVFVQSPATADESLDARPGYWVGEQSAPTLAEVDGMVAAIYRLDPKALLGFTHAWWPSPAFTEERIDPHWAFARHGDGYVGLWCSAPLQRAATVAQHAELRAYGSEHAWLAVASSQAEVGSFARFQEQCRQRLPAYDPVTGTLSLGGRPRLTYGQSAPVGGSP